MFPVPEGFREILYDFGIEILRSNPKDILEYGHEYFKAKDEGLPLNFNRPASEDQNVPKEDPKKSLPKEEPKSSSHEKEENKETPKGDGSGSPKDTAKLDKDKAHKQEIIKTPESKVSSAAEDVKKEAEKYVSDMIEKMKQVKMKPKPMKTQLHHPRIVHLLKIPNFNTLILPKSLL
ncbi:unnamed protein product [Moneuplotes crassus]|uniref:RIIa domain-containing protein n=1 Tax=Euplotes crassus TaxID=5936 RepID=A0AAD1XS77_EUPCR|nr:unnamed protein product [Moneuplotes crassus]